MQNNLFTNDILKRFEKTAKRKPATNRIYLIQQIADQCGMTWRDIFGLSQELIERELQEALDDGKQAGKMKQVKGRWIAKTPQEFQEGVKIRTLWKLKKFREELKAKKAKLKV